MTWDDQILAHEKKIRRHSLIAGILIGIGLTILSAWLIDYIVVTWRM
jgi:hypothetical protein